LSDIMEAFWPTATVRRASQRLSTETADLRRHIRQAAGDRSVQPVVNTGSRYHLNPDLVEIDVWHLVDHLREASAATDPDERVTALRHAIDAHTGVLADGWDYDWIDPAREQVRRNGVRARLHLAELLGPTDHHAAVQLTQEAVAIDPLNEDVAQRAMRALAAIGDTDGVRAQLDRLRAALDEIDEEPTTDTLALAADLQRDAATARSAHGDR
jgi:two-component SAPR family response regulator